MASVLDRVKTIVVDRLQVEEDKVVPSASFSEDLNADSLDLVELIMAIEEEFSEDGNAIEISDEDAAKILTVQQAADYIQGRGIQD